MAFEKEKPKKHNDVVKPKLRSQIIESIRLESLRRISLQSEWHNECDWHDTCVSCDRSEVK